MRFFLRTALGLVIAIWTSTVVHAQGTEITFSGLNYDASIPLEITADELTLDQATGMAVFIGDVVASQGKLRLGAARMVVQYATKDGKSTGRIVELLASGGVTVVSGAESAQADDAVYDVSSSEIVFSGDVILTQRGTDLTGDKLSVNLSNGSARMEGRVKTTFRTGSN